MDRLCSITGVLLGTAVGDTNGLPAEGLSRRRAARRFGGGAFSEVAFDRHRLLFGRGLVSDDTEHACMTAQALLAARGDPDRFARSLAWRLRGWLLALPAGVGSATARSILKLWVGFPPTRSGVRSAGNGPCMRAAILGVCARDTAHLAALVRASTRLTHTHPAAEQGALAVAIAARLGADVGLGGVSPDALEAAFGSVVTEPAVRDGIARARACLATGADAAAFAVAVGLPSRVSGYVNHTVPVALYCWLRWPGDVRAAVSAAAAAGGDTDTVAAIAGALVGATAGGAAVPADWLDGLLEWPRSVVWMRRLAGELAAAATDWDAAAGRPVPLFWPGLLPRNVLFLLVVLAHGVRRIFPPS
jgi:ADP-ribosyl-[dinitrogen reductase] hydrolase